MIDSSMDSLVAVTIHGNASAWIDGGRTPRAFEE
jgi:hypothetical protein